MILLAHLNVVKYNFSTILLTFYFLKVNRICNRFICIAEISQPAINIAMEIKLSRFLI